jgi:hypothetical protein
MTSLRFGAAALDERVEPAAVSWLDDGHSEEARSAELRA